MAEKKKILYIVEAMGGGVFTYIVDMQRENDPHKWIEQKGYDIKKETKKLDDFYLEKSNLINCESGRWHGKSKRVAKSSRLIWNGTGSDEQVLSWRYSNLWDRACFHFGNKK